MTVNRWRDQCRRKAVALRGGTELLAGVVQDPVFGPLVAFGPGGVLAELIGSTRLALAPLSDVDADELGRNIRAEVALEGDAKTVRGEARAVFHRPLENLEIVLNGRVIAAMARCYSFRRRPRRCWEPGSRGCWGTAWYIPWI